jgi:hypothetical protein
VCMVVREGKGEKARFWGDSVGGAGNETAPFRLQRRDSTALYKTTKHEWGKERVKEG